MSELLCSDIESESVRKSGEDLANPKMTFPIKKESVLNCLLMGNMSLIYTGDGSRTLDRTS